MKRKVLDDLNDSLHVKMNSELKNEVSEMADYYGFPHTAMYVRELLRYNVEIYKEKKEKEKLEKDGENLS